jgi:hypothetical protein
MVTTTMITWIVLGLLAMTGGGFIAYRVGKARGAHAALPARGGTGAAKSKERTIKEVRVDDILQYGGRDWLVEGVVAYDEDGHQWRGARTVDAPDERWFVVGMDRIGPVNVRVLGAATGLELTGYPPEAIEHGGTSYKLAQRGTATVTLTGNLGELPGAKGLPPGSATRCRWWRYSAAGEKQLLVEQWGEKYRALVGEPVPADQVDMLSAS